MQYLNTQGHPLEEFQRILNKEKCQLCEEPILEFRSVGVKEKPDDIGHFERWGLCERHLNEFRDQEGVFDPYKYV